GKPAAPGSELVDVIRIQEKHDPIRLLPESYAKACRLGKLRQWLWAGAAAAVLLIAMDGIGFHLRLDAMRKSMERVEGLSEQYDHMQQNGEKLRAAIVALDDLDRSLETEIGVMANYRAALQEISRLVPEDLRFTKIALKRVDAATQLSLTGYAFEGETLNSGQTLELFMAALQDSPMFSQTRIGNVQSAQYEKRTGQRFEISGTLIHVISDPGPEVITAALTESSP
ncbi:MAG: PilN domain-containing protein, partial [Planctomycetota bacterium]|nr:PilN domain-containing protein [Planctomycetota bacterium]